MGVGTGVLALPAQPPPELESVVDGVDRGGEGSVGRVVRARVSEADGEVGLALGGPGGGAAGDRRGDADAGEQVLLVGLEGVVLGALGGQPCGERAAGAGESGRGVQDVAALDMGVCLVPGALPFQCPGRVPPGIDRGQRQGPG